MLTRITDKNVAISWSVFENNWNQIWMFAKIVIFVANFRKKNQSRSGWFFWLNWAKISKLLLYTINAHFRWDYHNSFFFAGTLATTIGYGNISPETSSGKLFCLGFIVLGIPYFAYLMSVMSDVVCSYLKFFGKRQKKTKFNHENSLIMWIYFALGLIVMIILPSCVFSTIEGS